jgi:hypothetical protein
MARSRRRKGRCEFSARLFITALYDCRRAVCAWQFPIGTSSFDVGFAERLLDVEGLSGLSKFSNAETLLDIGDLILHDEEL